MMKIVFLLLLCCRSASSGTHSLRFFYTGSYGVMTFPEFVGVVMVDEVEVIYCDSSIGGAEPKQDWMRKLIKDDPEHMDWYSNECHTSHNTFKTTTEILMQSFNQTGGVHIYQRMFGCEWDDETAEVNGYDQYGYDGEDFIEFDLKTETWIAPTPQAVTTKHKWDNDRAGLFYIKNYLTQVCPEWLKKYVNYGRSSLLRTALPSVSLLQKTPSSPVSCHATGFYPDRAMMFWRKDGEELDEDVDQGEILPNHDGTFQMSVDLKSPAPGDWERYECVFQLSGVKEDIIKRLDKAGIRTNRVPPSEFPAAAVIGVVVGLLLLLLCISGLFIWRRNNNGFRPANTSDSSPPDAASN
ncbi:major histocompatibility complex class I-related gene protein isoform X2 [Lates calcarifer]|uniref:Major histocompatibility complex class I-related gene protein isoform X2 n=1 Tax=Lates calcarifer TaxID=8187 RepID=A0AAJ8B1P7_LATCA|nr:major histocompatibility complex class I-related gene protein isoform X2 [Lates calcarifer]